MPYVVTNRRRVVSWPLPALLLLLAMALPVWAQSPPVANNDGYAVQENQVLNVAAPGVLSNDTDSLGDPLAAGLVSGPTDGTLTLNANGSLTYTPNAGFVGTDSFTYQATDTVTSVLSNVATVSIVTISFTSVYSFTGTGADGADPAAGLTLGPNGSLYGVAGSGGVNDDGTVFNLTPAGTETTIHSFNGSDGNGPISDLVLGGDGNLYGTTGSNIGSGFGCSVFRITPDGTLTTIHQLGTSQLILGADGDLYGTTNRGGSNSAGSIFKVGLDGSGYTTLYSFSGTGADGGQPLAGLTLANDGNYYGTTTSGSSSRYGTIFKFVPSSGTLTTLHTFNATDGFYIKDRLVQGSDGKLYGVSTYGGNASGEFENGDGSIFAITTAGTFTTVYTFEGGAGGESPQFDLFSGADGALYGVADGGVNGDGTVFRLDLSGLFTTLYSFSGPDGSLPQGCLTQSPDGSLYGMTGRGGDGYINGSRFSGNGTIFKLNLGLQAPPPSVAPFAFNDAYSLSTGQNLSVGAPGVLMNDADIYGDPLMAVLKSSPSDGSLDLSADGSFTFTPNGGFTGTDSFTYQAQDSIHPALVSKAATVTISLLPEIAASASASPNPVTGTSTNLSVLGSYTGSGGESVLTYTWSETSGPAAVTFAPNGTNAAKNSVATFSRAGSYVLNVTVASPYASSSSSVNVDVVQMANDDWYADTVNQPLTIAAPGVLANDSDATGDPLTPILVAGPSNGSLSLNTDGSFTYTPNAGFAGTDTFTYEDTINPFTVSNVATVTITVLTFISTYSFTAGAEIIFPGTTHPGLALGPDGNFFGVDASGGSDVEGPGGASGDGMVYKLTPGGTLTPLHAFSGTDGSFPDTQLILGQDSKLFGATRLDASSGWGTIFDVTSGGSYSTLSTVSPNTAYADMTVGPDGDLYGTTNGGGAYDYGSIFKMGTDGSGYQLLYSFSGSGLDGLDPVAGLTLASDGNFYGTTGGDESPGGGRAGTVFQFSPSSGTLTTVHTFDGTDGYLPLGRLVEGLDGCLYGTSGWGGNGNDWSGDGSVFRITLGGVFTPVNVFDGSDGMNPYAGLTLASDGNLYGVTTSTVFRIGPSGSFTTLYTFSGPDGSDAQGSLMQSEDGSLYGTTESGGADGDGTIYKLDLGLPAPPLANIDHYAVSAGQPLAVPVPGVLGNDIDIYSDPLTATVVSNPGHGSLTLNANGSFNYTPNIGFSGVDTFTYENTDSADASYTSDTATVYLTATSPVTVATAAAATPNPVTGTKTNLSVLGAYPGKGGATVLSYTWSSTGPGSVSFSANGTLAARNTVATFSQAGSYTLTAAISDAIGEPATSSVDVTVNQTLTSITITPGPTVTLNPQTTQQFTATANDQFGNPLANQPAVAWSLASGSVGSVSASGLYHSGTVAGAATVKARVGGVGASVSVTVSEPPVTVVKAASAAPNPVTGTTTNLSVLGGYTGAAGAGVLAYTWSSTGPAAVTYSTNGTNAARDTTATFTQAGAYSITATIAGPYSQSTTSSVNVTVVLTATSIVVTPGPIVGISPPLPQTQQFTATVNDQFGNPLSPQPTISWSLASGSVGSISTGGLYHSGTVAGSATVKAKSGAISAAVTVLVNPPVTVSTTAAASPNPATGTTTSLSALGAYVGTGGAAGLTYTWSYTGPAGVTFSANGTNAAANTTATFTQAGSYAFTVTIANAYTSTTSSVTMTVNPTLTSIAVAPGPTLTLGPLLPQTQQFTATAVDQFGNALSPQPTFVWSLASGSVGSITASDGLYHSGAVAGSATVKAKSGTVMGTCAVTVN